MTKRVVECGDVDGEKTWCLAFVYYSKISSCNISGRTGFNHNKPCHCPELREARLRAQLGDSMVTTTTEGEAELVGLVRELVEFEPTEHCHILHQDGCVFCSGSKSDDGDEPIEHEENCLMTRARAELRKRGVEL
jgi:hypothetical protein